MSATFLHQRTVMKNKREIKEVNTTNRNNPREVAAWTQIKTYFPTQPQHRTQPKLHAPFPDAAEMSAVLAVDQVAWKASHVELVKCASWDNLSTKCQKQTSGFCRGPKEMPERPQSSDSKGEDWHIQRAAALCFPCSALAAHRGRGCLHRAAILSAPCLLTARMGGICRETGLNQEQAEKTSTSHPVLAETSH